MPSGKYIRSKETLAKLKNHARKLGLATRGIKRPSFSIEWRENISRSQKGRKPPTTAFKKGQKPWNWIEDRTQLSQCSDVHKSTAYNEWSKMIKVRDNWKCRIANEDCKGQLEAHHILSFVDYPELRYELNNGITLCHAHHPRKKVEVEKLAPIFQELVKG